MFEPDRAPGNETGNEVKKRFWEELKIACNERINGLGNLNAKVGKLLIQRNSKGLGLFRCK